MCAGAGRAAVASVQTASGTLRSRGPDRTGHRPIRRTRDRAACDHAGVLPTVCSTTDLLRLLPEALAGRRVLAPVDPGDPGPTLAMLHPDREVDEADAALIVATSGSTGAPKGVVLSRHALVAAAEQAERVTGPMDWFLALPGHYVAGAMVMVRAAVAGTRCVPVRSDLADLPAVTRPSAVSIVPTQLHRALRRAASGDRDPVARLATYRTVLVGGAGTDAADLDAAERAGIAVVTTYGMSETCGGCVWNARPLPGVEVRIGEAGRIELGGPMVFSGYRLRPDLTAGVLRDGRVVTQDRGRLVEGRLEVLGRLDDVVISGGVNVDLAEVQRAAASLGGVECAVVGAPDPEWGTRVVLATTDPRPLDAWRDLLRDRLEAPALPRQLLRLSALPRTSSGKIDRQGLIRLAGSDGPTDGEDARGNRQ